MNQSDGGIWKEGRNEGIKKFGSVAGLAGGAGGVSSPRKIRLDPSHSNFDPLQASDLMKGAYNTDRYSGSKLNKTLESKMRHPPRLSPRANNKSVDPIARSQFMMLGGGNQKNVESTFMSGKMSVGGMQHGGGTGVNGTVSATN